MGVKNSTGKTGSGSQSDESAPGEHEDGGGTNDESGDESQESEGGGKQGEAKGEKKQSDELDLSTLPKEAQDYIKKLRRESAKYRTKATNLESSYSQLTNRVRQVAGGGEEGEEAEMSVEQRLEIHEQNTATLAFDNAVLACAVDHGIDAAGLKYFRFLVNEKASELGEGEELSDEDLAEIAEEARSTTGRGRKGAKTSVTGDEGGKGGEGKAPVGKNTVTIEQFAKMTVSQKSDLQKNNPDLYAALFQEAVQKRRFL